jgi:DNA polymerase-3 subunit alpha
LEHLVKAGAFDKLGERHLMLANLEAAMLWGAAQREMSALGQVGLFGAEEVKPPVLTETAALGELELLRMEKEALGLYISSHPMQSYPGLAAAASCSVLGVEACFRRELEAGARGRVRLVLAGILQNVTRRPTKKGSMMARFDIADETGSREVVAFSRVYDEVAGLLADDAPVVLVAEVSEDGEGVRLVAERLIRWDARGDLPELAVLSFELDALLPDQLAELRSSLDEYGGRLPVELRFASQGCAVAYRPEGVQVDRGGLGTLRERCPWLQTAVTLDTDRLLRAAPPSPQRAAPPAPNVQVPF